MRRRVVILSALAVGLLLLAPVGCGGPGEAPIPAEETPPRVTATEPPEEAAEPARPAPTGQQRIARTPAYRPPFPDRTELFVPPSSAKRVARRNNGDFEESVELVGFAHVAHVDKPYALLSINGVPTSVAVSGTKSGVQVISIQEPNTAVLQLGRNRWTATLD